MTIAKRRFLITGGFSLIGSHIADQLLAANAEQVVLLDNGALGHATTVSHLVDNPRVRMVRGDILRIEDVVDVMDGMSGVFHTAAFITLPLSQQPVLGLDVNVRGLINVLECCRWAGVGKIVYSSSISAFGSAGGVINETTPFAGAGVQPASALYGLSKLMGEQLCALYRQRHGIDWMAVRCATVYGERQHARGLNVVPIVKAHDRIRRGKQPVVQGGPLEVHDYVYVGDVARGHVMAMDRDVSGEVVTLATGQLTTLDALIRVVLKVCGSDLDPVFDQGERLKTAGTDIERFDVEKAERVLGWTTEVALEDGIRQLIAWRESVIDA